MLHILTDFSKQLRKEVSKPMVHENLKGRVAVVTGGGGVLCGDFAKALAKQGVKVAVLDLNELILLVLIEHLQLLPLYLTL